MMVSRTTNPTPDRLREYFWGLRGLYEIFLWWGGTRIYTEYLLRSDWSRPHNLHLIAPST